MYSVANGTAVRGVWECGAPDWRDPNRMVVGTLQLSLAIPGASSLKDKRRAIKSLKDRLGSRHNVSVAEVALLNDHRRGVLALAMVSNDRRFTEGCLSKIVDEVRKNRCTVLVDYELELF